MTGETQLKLLLQSMQPQLLADDYVFISVENSQYGELSELKPKAMFMESEGMTLVVPESLALQHGYYFESVFQCITLQIHSSLDAVGLTAAFATKLADCGLSANVIAGFYHDHIFVQKSQATLAVAALNALVKESS